MKQKKPLSSYVEMLRTMIASPLSETLFSDR